MCLAVDSFGRKLSGINDSQIKSYDVKALYDLHQSHFLKSSQSFPWMFFDDRDSKCILLFSKEYKFIIFAKF